jgi:hypothetical protein
MLGHILGNAIPLVNTCCLSSDVAGDGHILRNDEKSLQPRKESEYVEGLQYRIHSTSEVWFERVLLEESKLLSKAVFRNDIGGEAAMG